MATQTNMVKTFKTISLKDYEDAPYATYVAIGYKPIETRKWQTPYRGDLLIHCSMGSSSLNAGNLLCVFNLDRIGPFTESMSNDACCSYVPGQFAWHLTNHRLLLRKPQPGDPKYQPFTKAKGQLSIYDTVLDMDKYDLVEFDFDAHAHLVDPGNVTGWMREIPPTLLAEMSDPKNLFS